jgi:HK97 gp10 family phage protein
VRVEGAQEAIRNLATSFRNAETAAKAAMIPAGRAIEAAATAMAPKDSRELADGIETKPLENGAEVVSEAPHSIHVEYGTSEQPAQPFMRPAMDSVGPAAVRAAARIAKQAAGAS